MKLMKNTLLRVSKLIAIAISDCKATIEIAFGDLFSNQDLKFDQDRDRDRDRNFRDRGHALILYGQHTTLKNARDFQVLNAQNSPVLQAKT